MWMDGETRESSDLEAPDAAISHVFEGKPVRACIWHGEPWFVAADVCRVLGLGADKGSYASHLAKLDPDEKAQISRNAVLRVTPGFNLESRSADRSDDNPASAEDGTAVWLVSESGLYTMILRSRGATTPGTFPHRFRRWVTREVLPGLRRTSQGQAVRDGNLHLSLEAPGRYLVSALPGHPVHIQRMGVLSVGRDMRASDVEVLALNCQLIGSLWRRLRTLHSMEIPTTHGFTDDQLDRAITNAEQVGGHLLRAIREFPQEDVAA